MHPFHCHSAEDLPNDGKLDEGQQTIGDNCTYDTISMFAVTIESDVDELCEKATETVVAAIKSSSTAPSCSSRSLPPPPVPLFSRTSTFPSPAPLPPPARQPVTSRVLDNIRPEVESDVDDLHQHHCPLESKLPRRKFRQVSTMSRLTQMRSIFSKMKHSRRSYNRKQDKVCRKKIGHGLLTSLCHLFVIKTPSAERRRHIGSSRLGSNGSSSK